MRAIPRSEMASRMMTVAWLAAAWAKASFEGNTLIVMFTPGRFVKIIN
jgi:hypothetical protein